MPRNRGKRKGSITPVIDATDLEKCREFLNDPTLDNLRELDRIHAQKNGEKSHLRQARRDIIQYLRNEQTTIPPGTINDLEQELAKMIQYEYFPRFKFPKQESYPRKRKPKPKTIPQLLKPEDRIIPELGPNEIETETETKTPTVVQGNVPLNIIIPRTLTNVLQVKF